MLRRDQRFCFTCFNYQKVRKFTTIAKDPMVQYIVVQMERCPNTKKLHLQGYAEFKKKLAPNVALKTLEIELLRGHLSNCRGDQKANIKYCTKKESRVSGPWIYGTPLDSNPGHREQLKLDKEEFIRQLQAGKDLFTLIKEDPITYYKLRNNAGIKDIARVNETPYRRPNYPKVYVLIGETGSGKTKWATTEWPEACLINCTLAEKFMWEDYKGQKTIILDEFRSQPSITVMNMIMNDGLGPIAIKHSHGHLKTDTIVICTTTSPTLWYKGDPARFEFIRRMKEYGTWIRMVKFKPIIIHRPTVNVDVPMEYHHIPLKDLEYEEPKPKKVMNFRTAEYDEETQEDPI